MKTPLLLSITAALALFTGVAHADPTPAEVLTEAQTAYIRGDMDTARERFEFVLKLDPKNVTAQNYLRTIAVAQRSSNQGADLERQLKALVLPHVEFKDASFATALEYLKQQAAKASNGKTVVSFVVQVPKDVFDTKTVNLNLSNVPLTVVLQYMAEGSDLKIVFDKYAVIVKQPGADPVPAPAPAATGATSSVEIPGLPVPTVTTVTGALK